MGVAMGGVCNRGIRGLEGLILETDDIVAGDTIIDGVGLRCLPVSVLIVTTDVTDCVFDKPGDNVEKGGVKGL